MRGRNRDFDNLLRQMPESENTDPGHLEDGGSGPKAERSRSAWKRVLLWCLAHAVPIAVLLAFMVAALVAGGLVMSFVQTFLGSSREGQQYTPSYVNGVDYKGFFSGDSGNIPFGIPVERGYISEGFGDGKNLFGITAYSSAHDGLDFSRIYGDKVAGYYPFIFATHDAVVVHSETRYDDPENASNYTYEKKLYLWGTYVNVRTTVKKSQAQGNINVKPYGKNVLLSSLDGRFYTLYAHLSDVRSDITDLPRIARGDILGNMGNTGNSFGAHLHYEIRYCGEDNSDYSKLLRQCTAINPLETAPQLQDNYLGFDPSKTRTVYAGTQNVLKLALDTDNAGQAGADSEIRRTYDSFCRDSAALFAGKDATCADVFPIVYQKRNNQEYPAILDPADIVAAGESYVTREYGNPATFDPSKLSSVALLEGLPPGSYSYFESGSLYMAIGKNLSYGKYDNRSGTAFKIPKLLQSNGSTSADGAKMLSELIDTVGRLKKENSGMEGAYAAYFRSAAYYAERKQDPRLYNFSDAKTVFMYLKDSSGKPTLIFREFGVMPIYSKISAKS